MPEDQSTRAGAITWDENRKTGRGELTLSWDDGRKEVREWPDPITASSDSHAIAAVFGDFEAVEHDGEFVHVIGPRS